VAAQPARHRLDMVITNAGRTAHTTIHYSVDRWNGSTVGVRRAEPSNSAIQRLVVSDRKIWRQRRRRRWQQLATVQNMVDEWQQKADSLELSLRAKQIDVERYIDASLNAVILFIVARSARIGCLDRQAECELRTTHWAET